MRGTVQHGTALFHSAFSSLLTFCLTWCYLCLSRDQPLIHRHLTYALAMTVTWGCGSQASSADGESLLNSATLDALSGGSVIYGYSYVAAPPEGQQLRVAVHMERDAIACEKYGADLQSSSEFWYLAAELSGATAGAYPIRESDAEERPTATLQAIRIIGLEKRGRYRAGSGSVTIDRDPTSDDGPILVDIATSLPTRGMLQSGECNAEGTASAQLSSQCTCHLTDGSTQVCTAVSTEDCCVNLAMAKASWIEFSMTAQAAFCRRMCTFTSPELARYCISAD